MGVTESLGRFVVRGVGFFDAVLALALVFAGFRVFVSGLVVEDAVRLVTRVRSDVAALGGIKAEEVEAEKSKGESLVLNNRRSTFASPH